MITLLHLLGHRVDALRSQKSLSDKACLTVQFVNPSTSLRTCLSTALETCFARPAWTRSPTHPRPSRLRISVLTVNFTIRSQPLPISQCALAESESRVQIVNFTIHHPLWAWARARSSRPQFSVQTVNFERKTSILRLPLSPLPRVQFVNFAPLASAVTDPVAVARQVSLKDRS